MSNSVSKSGAACLGWREWVELPELGLPWIKAKVDTGARTSALHAFDIEHFARDGRNYVRFKVHPRQRNEQLAVVAEAELIDERRVRSSAGRETVRPVIRTTLHILDQRVPIELTLVSRRRMKFRMLIGREVLRDRFVVDTGRSYLGGRRARMKGGRRRSAETAPE